MLPTVKSAQACAFTLRNLFSSNATTCRSAGLDRRTRTKGLAPCPTAAVLADGTWTQAQGIPQIRLQHECSRQDHHSHARLMDSTGPASVRFGGHGQIGRAHV